MLQVITYSTSIGLFFNLVVFYTVIKLISEINDGGKHSDWRKPDIARGRTHGNPQVAGRPSLPGLDLIVTVLGHCAARAR